MSELKISDEVEALLQALRRHSLRHPGSVSRRVLKLIGREIITLDQIAAARMEFLKLGLDRGKGVPS